jgi:hypothetical protein
MPFGAVSRTDLRLTTGSFDKELERVELGRGPIDRVARLR